MLLHIHACYYYRKCYKYISFLSVKFFVYLFVCHIYISPFSNIYLNSRLFYLTNIFPLVFCFLSTPTRPLRLTKNNKSLTSVPSTSTTTTNTTNTNTTNTLPLFPYSFHSISSLSLSGFALISVPPSLHPSLPPCPSLSLHPFVCAFAVKSSASEVLTR